MNFSDKYSISRIIINISIYVNIYTCVGFYDVQPLPDSWLDMLTSSSDYRKDTAAVSHIIMIVLYFIV
jgi:hypothetical protein